ncbi:MAG: hypothetical protein QW434_03350 [Pyrobaculum sp.]
MEGGLMKRLEIALMPQPPPTLEEVLAEIGRRGVLSGGLNRVVEGYKKYVAYVTEKMVEVFKPGEALQSFSHALITLLEQARLESIEKLNSIKREVERGNTPKNLKVVEFEGHVSYYVRLRRNTTTSHFPDLLKIPREELEKFQIGWRASDETKIGDLAAMFTTQPWQIFAWLATRPGKVKMSIRSLILTRRGPSFEFLLISPDWAQRWDKLEAVRQAVRYIKQGEYKPLLTWWLGDGSVKWSFVEKRHYKLRITVKSEYKDVISQNLGAYFERGENYIYIPGGKKLFKALIESAGRYGEMLKALHSHKWLYLESVNKPRRVVGKVVRGPAVDNIIKIGDIEMRLTLVYNEGGSLYATKEAKSYQVVKSIADKLREYGLNPRISKAAQVHRVYLSTKELRRLIAVNNDIKNKVKEFLEHKIAFSP